jgi:catechol 2,3-dioxygenase-like lactoylglutathione lyase family enzyme
MKLPISHQITWVYTDNLDSTCRFYTDALDLPLVLDQGNSRVFHVEGGSFIGVCLVREGRWVEPKGVVITLVTDKVDAWHDRLKTAGIASDAPVLNTRWDIYHFFVRDPNGYLIEFQEFRDPRWPPALSKTTVAR